MKSLLIKNDSIEYVFFGVCRGLAFLGIVAMIILTFSNISCKPTNIQNMEQKRDTFTGKLSILDSALDKFAKSHQTKVLYPKTKYYPPVEISLEEREVSWINVSIAKAVIIKPYTTNLGPKSDAWDFYILAWIIDASTLEKPFREFCLLKNADINTLKSKIEDLLSQAEQKLKDIKLEDLK